MNKDLNEKIIKELDSYGIKKYHLKKSYDSIEKIKKKITDKYFYEETPYANVEEDILRVAKAIEYKRKNQEITFKAPAFYGNMMSLVYKV